MTWISRVPCSTIGVNQVPRSVDFLKGCHVNAEFEECDVNKQQAIIQEKQFSGGQLKRQGLLILLTIKCALVLQPHFPEFLVWLGEQHSRGMPRNTAGSSWP